MDEHWPFFPETLSCSISSAFRQFTEIRVCDQITRSLKLFQSVRIVILEFQGCFIVQLSRFFQALFRSVLLSLSELAHLVYHTVLCLSTTFFIFFKLFCFFKIVCIVDSICSLLTACTFYHIICDMSTTFLNFFKFQKVETEKEGFEPSRRANDLHP